MDRKEYEYTDLNQELQDAALAVAAEQQAAGQTVAPTAAGSYADQLKQDALAAVTNQQQQAAPAQPLSYQEQLKSIYDQIQNRQPFQYDMNADPLYQQYKDQYVNNGRLAMKDTVGQAAALTGGYGNTYGQQAGQQAYNAFLQNLSAVIPNLYSMAYNMYRDRGDDLMKQYAWLQQNKPPVTASSGGGGRGGRGGGSGGNGSQLGLGAVAGAAGGLGAGLMAALGGALPQSAAPEYQTRGQVIRGAQQALDNGSITYAQYKNIMSQYDYKAPQKESEKRGGSQR